MRYRLKALHVGGIRNKIFTRRKLDGSITIVTDSDFYPGHARNLEKQGFLERIDSEKNDFTIGIVIPTKGNRPYFLGKAVSMIKRQTLKPDFVKIVDKKTRLDVDIALRYEHGFRFLFKKGCDIVICWEDDDWYSEKYVEIIAKRWEENCRPSIYGVCNSIYYHIVAKKYAIFIHRKRASMMATAVTSCVLKNKFDVNNPYLDIDLWRDNKGKTFLPEKPICVGIKHGFTKTGGGGHQLNWARYNIEDENYEKLKEMTGIDSAFYELIVIKENYKITKVEHGKNPVVSVITRRHGDNRPQGLSKHKAAISKMKGNFEQIFIKDKKGMGMRMANTSFQLVFSQIKGKYVYLLDDDDYFIDYNIFNIIKNINADVIFVKMWIGIRGGGIYPQENVWNKSPVRGSIGGSCFFVSKEIYMKFIHNFAHERMGDFEFISKVFESGAKCVWLDRVISKTFSVSRGSKE